MLDHSSLESEAHACLDHAVLLLILDTGWPLSEAEIARAIDVPGHVPDSLKRLRRAGLIHRWNDLATPSHPAVRLHAITQSNGEDGAGPAECRRECAVLKVLLRSASDGERPLSTEQLHDALNASKRKQQARINAALDRLDAAGLIERRGGHSIAAEVAMHFDQLMTPDEHKAQAAI
jgi:predicted transcriptional regulator